MSRCSVTTMMPEGFNCVKNASCSFSNSGENALSASKAWNPFLRRCACKCVAMRA